MRPLKQVIHMNWHEHPEVVLSIHVYRVLAVDPLEPDRCQSLQQSNHPAHQIFTIVRFTLYLKFGTLMYSTVSMSSFRNGGSW
jgi:hypothetical protein